MINVVALYPAFDAQFNEMAMVWQTASRMAGIGCTVLTVGHDPLKGHHSHVTTETFEGGTVYRLPDLTPTPAMFQIARNARPDVIFAGTLGNLPPAFALQKATGAPVILHQEYFLDDVYLLRRRWYLGLKTLRPAVSSLARRYFHSRCALVLTSNPKELVGQQQNTYPRLRYLPWPHPQNSAVHPRQERDSQYGAFVGSLSKAKGVQTLLAYYDILLTHQPDYRVHLVGPLIDTMSQTLVAAFARKHGPRVTLTPHLPRQQALEELGKTLFVISPAHRLGWGLIGDSWNAGTPVIATAEHYDLQNGVNCAIAESPDAFLATVLQLQTDTAFWERISGGGRETAGRHTVEHVASILATYLEEVGAAGK